MQVTREAEMEKDKRERETDKGRKRCFHGENRREIRAEK